MSTPVKPYLTLYKRYTVIIIESTICQVTLFLLRSQVSQGSESFDIEK